MPPHVVAFECARGILLRTTRLFVLRPSGRSGQEADQTRRNGSIKSPAGLLLQRAACGVFYERVRGCLHLIRRSLLGRNKILARRYAERRLPAHVAARKKRVFHIPPERYLDAPIFQEFVARTLQRGQIQRRGYFNPDAVRELLDAARATREFVRVKQVLALVMLEIWHQIFIDRVAWI